jgi:hypothetical protein
MNKMLLGAAAIILLGAGCAGTAPADNAGNPNNNPPAWNSNADGNSNQDDDANVNGNSNANSNANVNSGDANVPPLPPEDLTLQPLPEVKPPKKPIDESSWSKTETKAGITVTFPTKGGFAPFWSYQALSDEDPHLRGNCYVTADTVYEKTSFALFTDPCQTTTSFGGEAGTRTDYFTFKTGSRINMITFTRNYSAGFDMDEYGAVLDRIINLVSWKR